MKKTAGWIFIISLLMPLGLAWAGDTLSLTVNQAVAMSLQNYPSVRQALEQAGAAEARVDQSKSGYYPTVTGEAVYNRLHPIEEVAFGSEVFQMFPADNYDMHIGLRHNLFDFGKTSTQLNLSRTYQKTSQDNLQAVKTDLTFQAIKSFYAVLYLARSVAVEKEEISILQDHLDETGKKVKAGTATDFETLTTQVRVALAQNRRIDLENMLRKQDIQLTTFLGVANDTRLDLQGDFTVAPVELDEAKSIDQALQERVEVKLARDMETAAKVQEKLSKYGNKPTIDLNFSYGVKNGYLPDLNERVKNWVAGGDLKIPLIDGLRTHYQEKEAVANFNAAQARRLEVEKQITTDVRQAVSDYSSSLEKLSATDLQVKLAQTALDQARIRYDAGVITNLDLLDAENSLSQARLMQLDAAYSYVLSNYALQKATGVDISRLPEKSQ